jgi:uncharacterized protein
MKNVRWVVLACVILTSISYAVPKTEIPKLNQRVNDFTNTLSFQEWQEIDRLLKSYEDTASTQVVVLMINSLDEISVEDYAHKAFEENKIGQTQQASGVLLVVVKQDQIAQVATGSGIQGVLTNAILSQIIRKEIQPHLKANNYFGGIVTGVDAMIRAKKGEYSTVALEKLPWLPVSFDIVCIIFYAMSIIVLLVFLLTLRRVLKRRTPERRMEKRNLVTVLGLVIPLLCCIGGIVFYSLPLVGIISLLGAIICLVLYRKKTSG